MTDIVNTSIDEFLKEAKCKTLVVYGAGNKAKHLYEVLPLEQMISFFIDKDSKKSFFQGKNEKIPIYTLQSAKKKMKNVDNIIILITPKFCALEIVNELDNCPELAGVKCYIGNLLQDYYTPQEFNFTKDIEYIPRKIHYCWFGEKEIPDQLKKCIDSWYKFCPDYEIKRWDETNYDITINRYMKEAYECKKWGFVPDYARLDIVYKEGGIYLDTDVELVDSLDKLLCDEMFCGAYAAYRSALGLGFGAKKNHELIKQLRQYYEDKTFIDEFGNMNLKPCADYQDPVLKKHGFSLKNEYQKIGKVVYYPSEVLNPTGTGGTENFTQRTIAIHHEANSWMSSTEKKAFYEYRTRIMKRCDMK